MHGDDNSKRAWELLIARIVKVEQELDETARADKAERAECIRVHDRAMSELLLRVETNRRAIDDNRLNVDRTNRGLRDRALLYVAVIAASLTAIVALCKGIGAVIDLLPKLVGLLR